MSVLALRRYLQPSPTLRWHPWAPLVALLLALLMAFIAGGAVAYQYSQQIRGAEADAQAFFTAMHRLDEKAANPRGVIQEAAEMDRAVLRYVATQRSSSISLYKLQQFVPLGKTIDTLPMVKRIAEYRIAELSGRAPRWLVTAGYCDRLGAPLSGENVAYPYEGVARAYSSVLGRTISAISLAPAVPGGICESKLPSLQ